MGMQRRKFEAGFKQQIVSDDESGMLSVNPASRKYQLSGSVIDRWRQQACHGGLEATPWAREKTPERENRELKGKPDFFCYLNVALRGATLAARPRERMAGRHRRACAHTHS